MIDLLGRLGFCVLFVFATSQAQEPSSIEISSANPTLDEVLVTGEQPGPGLWKVTREAENGDHVLWILGTYSPLPKDITWKSREVEKIIANSQQVLAWVVVKRDSQVGFFTMVSLLPSLRTADHNPDNALLRDVLPNDVYVTWSELKTKYVGKDGGIEKLRPMPAMYQLHAAALADSKLTTRPLVWKTVEKLANEHKVKIVRPVVESHLKVSKPRAALKTFKSIHVADIECFKLRLAEFEPGIAEMKARANAWAVGDVTKLLALPNAPSTICNDLEGDAVLNSELEADRSAREMVDAARREEKRVEAALVETWLRSVDDAMTSNKITFAVVPTSRLRGPHDLLANLRERGYQIQEP